LVSLGAAGSRLDGFYTTVPRIFEKKRLYSSARVFLESSFCSF
jgi:hypothetical protein